MRCIVYSVLCCWNTLPNKHKWMKLDCNKFSVKETMFITSRTEARTGTDANNSFFGVHKKDWIVNRNSSKSQTFFVQKIARKRWIFPSSFQMTFQDFNPHFVIGIQVSYPTVPRKTVWSWVWLANKLRSTVHLKAEDVCHY